MTSVSPTSFRRSLYAEHHEELSFLYGQLCRLRADEAVPRTALADFERRLVAHLDALVIGDELAADEVRGRQDWHDARHVYVATLLACAVHDQDALHDVMRLVESRGPDESAPDAGPVAEESMLTPVAALVDALRHAMPAAWDSQWSAWVVSHREPLQGWLADAASFSRSPSAGAAIAAAFEGARQPSARLVAAAGRSGSSALVPRLATLCAATTEQGSMEVGAAALRAWAMLDRAGALAEARSARDRGELSHRLLGSIGGADEASILVRRLASGSTDTVLALGLLGELSAVRPLMAALADARLASAAAQALVWITGAEVGTAASDGAVDDSAIAPLGDAADAQHWDEWLTRAASRFVAGTAYRFGAPKTPQAVAQAWLDHRAGALYRRWAAEEMRLRYGAPGGVDLRASQGRQRQQAQALVAWSRATDAR